MNIREAVADDEQSICALWSQVFDYREARNEPAKVLANKLCWDSLLLVAEQERRVLGTVMIGYDGHRGWLYRLAVAEEARRRGIGRQLVAAAEQRLAALGCTKVNLQLHLHNEAGARFWEAIGYGREARISMGKDLLDPECSGRDAGC